MIYAFKDTTAGAAPATYRSAESLSIDGTYLEDALPGFRVLYTTGREALPVDITTGEIAGRDGSVLMGKRFPAREIVVGYSLKTPGPAAYRAAFNSLFSYLKGEHRLIFADEQDKFFIGHFLDVTPGEPGTDTAVGEITFLCADPFKYSMTEYSADTLLQPVKGADGVTRNLRSFLVTYRGTVPARPRFETTFKQGVTDVSDGTLPTNPGDCGYIAFTDQHGHILQFGDPDETDGQSFAASQMLLNTVLYNKSSWSTNTRNLWKTNTGSAYVDATIAPRGSMYSTYSKVVTSEEQAQESAGTLDGLRYLTPQTYGTGSADGWHGPTIAARVPVDASRTRGAADWRLYFRAKIGASEEEQFGVFKVAAVTSAGVVVASMEIKKGSSSMNGKVILKFGTKSKTIAQDLSYYNAAFGANGRHAATITKSGSKCTFSFGDKSITLTDTGQTSVKVERVAFSFGQYRKGGTERTSLSRNGLYNTKFTKLNCQTWEDTPNKFSSGDVLSVDCSTAEVLLNGEPAADLGALGNDWETLTLVPGEQYIIESRSSWVKPENRPTSKMFWREVFA